MDLIDTATNFVILKVSNLLPNGIINDLITGGILPGLGGILIFIPQIAILFFIISILEESGYMSRVVFLFDKILSKFGLNGRSMIALISGGACAIPAVMSARTINNAKERLITIMVAPLISCSARLPVYALMIGFIVPKSYWLGFINYQTIAYICIYIISTFITLVVAWFLKTIIRSSENSMLMIPMPIYRMPTFKNILIIVFEKVKTFVLEAGKIMLIISILLWGLFRFSPTNNLELEKESLSYATEKKLTAVETEVYLNQQKIEHSYAGYLGKYIEPIIKPLGYDWKIGIGLIASFAAREVFVGTMSTIYSLESDDKNINKVEKMKKEKWDDGKPVYTLASSVSLILF